MGHKSSKVSKRAKEQQSEVDPVQRKKNARGFAECEVLGFGPEAQESAAAWRSCRKNPDHATFTPASEFSLAHLPEEYRENPVLEFIRGAAALTVRLRVNYVSVKRPKGYAFGASRGSRVPHVGSGRVTEVSPGEGPCPCESCAESPSSQGQASRSWFEISVGSACHVLYNTEEARNTRVDFFFDSEASRREGKVKTVSALKVVGKDKKSDACTFTCASHDEELYNQLQTALEDFNQARKSGFPKGLPKERLMVVVSHPHGQPKQVTLGPLAKYVVEWAEPRASALTWTLYYRADTCPGSSGAPVFAISSEANSHVYRQGSFHSGWRSKGNHSVVTYTCTAAWR
ncbi:hypothetical protein EGW08_020790 [Elysia chlorotica]|uniref:Uncharacterized protein n=1 Tax=Elysia chlorotica TaxID=188477 RepID=A0A3S0ZNC6_ELYCH|nr:hypothetical protein EGW08_020790 [Elysia chlorotica]